MCTLSLHGRHWSWRDLDLLLPLLHFSAFGLGFLWQRFFGRGEPVRLRTAGVARVAGFPLGSLAKMPADLQVTAILRLDEIANFVVALPGAVFLRRIVNLADEIRVQTCVTILPEKNAIRRQAVTPGASRFLVILLDRFRQ